ncbi:hypothetical protein M427DRAFT_152232 [Gonapodya prolifera JEL478]|uniref:Condensin complex subunit 1 n=1 Tax=Gonapodya prolifera (strain JEL478) TaxID=1344416 RepID=A0A139ASQ8_GONPJ|nr:hypothetical protein M427DRAFT_152232 [Gonapodya prolifera JEL478]|eukprot:KXS19739.1 hypothetical protein M427DRAFT_152232 [Gonapodya prolifera JEL478]
MDLHEQLLWLDEGSLDIPDEFAPGSSPDEIEPRLNEIVDSIENDPMVVADTQIYDLLRSFLKYFETLSPEHRLKLATTIISALSSVTALLSTSLSSDSSEAFRSLKDPVAAASFLLHWLLRKAEKVARSEQSQSAATGGSTTGKGTKGAAKGKKKAATAVDDGWDWVNLRERALRASRALLVLDVERVFISTAERDSLVNLFTKPIYQCMEDKEALRQFPVETALDVLCVCVAKHGHGFGAKTTIFLNLTSYDHLSELMADFLHDLATKYGHTQLSDEVLTDVGHMDFNVNEGEGLSQRSTLPKSFATFLVRLATSNPKLVLRHMVALQNLLDAESYTIRSAFVEVIGALVEVIYGDSEDKKASDTRLEQFWEVLLERTLDSNAFVRAKVMQTIQKLAGLVSRTSGQSPRFGIPLNRRYQAVDATIGRLRDKSSIVRKNAIRTLAYLIESHPYAIPGIERRSLNMAKLSEQRSVVEEMLKGFMRNLEGDVPELKVMSAERRAKSEPVEENPNDVSPAAEEDSKSESAESGEPDDRSTQPPDDDEDIDAEIDMNIFDRHPVDTNDSAADILGRKIPMLKLTLRWLNDAQRLVRQLEHAATTLCQLLASKSKPEVIESMDVFVVMHHFEMECAADGIRRMVHLIWSKDNNSEEGGKTIRDHLLDTYGELYFTAQGATEKEKTQIIVNNLIRLTSDATLADLTSLEQLLSTMMSKGTIKLNEVVRQLWITFSRPDVSKEVRRGSLIIISMFAKAKPDIISEQMDLLLKVGLGRYGKEDLILAKYACIGLQQLVDDKRKDAVRYEMSHPMFSRIARLLQENIRKDSWFAFAEQAINTVFNLSEQPDKISSSIIKVLTANTFGERTLNPDNADTGQPVGGNESVLDENDSQPGSSSLRGSEGSPLSSCDSFDLAKLLFVVGHVGIKQIVYLEIVESELKKRKAVEPTRRVSRPGGDEIEQVVGSTDDEFTDAISHVREKELLYGGNSLLAKFAPVIKKICQYNKTFDNRTLQIHASLALCKFMCVSSEFCESNLQLLFTILEKCDDPVIRSNIIIALGDMTVSFNTLIDDNINYLYNRLNDSDPAVKKNTLMVLTHLIINGMIKVKGQISEMAKCLEDSDNRIADLARLFFTELASKDNAIYNNLPDIISNLSHPTNGIEEDKFKSVMKFLLEFIDKERQTENLVDKLCLRFRSAEGERQWRDISFCLTLLSFKSDKSVKKLIDHSSTYGDKLHEETVYKHFVEILAKAKKFQKATAKQLIEDFEGKLNELREACVANHDTVTNASKVPTNKINKARARKAVVPESTGAESTLETENKPVKAPKRAPGGRRKVVSKSWDDESDDDRPKRKGAKRTVLGEADFNHDDAEEEIVKPKRRNR